MYLIEVNQKNKYEPKIKKLLGGEWIGQLMAWWGAIIFDNSFK